MAKYLVQHRRGTAAQWADKNTIIPREGEIVIEIDEENYLHKLKIGDGVHTYAQLAYLKAGDELVTQVLAEAKPRIVTVELTTDWVESNGKYGQVIALDGITEHSRLDLQPDVDMLAEFKNLNLIFTTENKNGVITVYSAGDMPKKAYEMQATIIETNADCEKIVGVPVGIPIAQTSLNKNFSNAIKGKASGKAVVLTDVSPLEHEMKVKIFKRGASIQKCGRNLFDYETFFINGGLKMCRYASVPHEDGYTMNVKVLQGTVREFIDCPYTIPSGFVGQTLIWRGMVSSHEGTTKVRMRVKHADGTHENGGSVDCAQTSQKVEISFNCQEGDKVYFLSGTPDQKIEVHAMMLCVDDGLMQFYEKHIPPVTYDAVGYDVTGVTSLYPYTVLFSNTSGVTIEAEYNKDINKVIDNLTQAIISTGGNV